MNISSDSGLFLRALAHLLPAMARPPLREALRAGLGGALALGLMAVLLERFRPETAGMMLIAPLGATAFLLFAVPNSPLAQPWPALVGNMLSALVATAVVMTGLPQPIDIILAIGGSFVAMALARAMHPPGAAVALWAVLAAPVIQEIGYAFVLTPVAVDSALLILAATIWNRATGRAYPFRLPIDAPSPPAPIRRALPPPEELETLLESLRLTANIGVEDLTRLLEELERRHPHSAPPPR